VERGEEEFRFAEKDGGAMLRSSRALRGFLGVIASVSASPLAFASPSIFTNANEMGAIAVVSSAACKVKFLCVFSFLDYSMVMELLEEEKRAENLLGFSCAGSSWIGSETIIF
jgi:hypothetical protein